MANGIQHSDITDDEDLGRVLLLRAFHIAPQLRTVLDDSDEKKTAIAVLRRVANRFSEAGTGAVESLSRNGTSMKLRDVAGAFTNVDISDLRLIFDLPQPAPLGPVGSFPPAGVITRLWPEVPR